MEKRIEVILVEDQMLIRQGTKALLEMENIFTIAEAEHGKELRNLLEVKKLKPDLILLDIEMPVMDGNKTLDYLTNNFPEIKVIILSTFSEGSLKNDFIAKGAIAFLNKNTDGYILAETIRDVLYLKGFGEMQRKAKSIFTANELKIIPLMLQGKTSKEIADKFSVTEKAIEGSRNRLYLKTGCSNSVGFSSYCTKAGLAYLGNSSINENQKH